MINYDEFLKAKDLVKQRKYNLALEILESLLEKEPNDNIIKFELAKLLIKLNQKDRARNYFKELLNTQSKKFALLELGRLEASEGNIEKARKYFEELCKYGGKDKAYAILELGRLEASIGNIEKARKYFKELLNGPNRIYALLELGRLEASEGNIEKARKYFKELLNTKSKNFALLELGRLEASEGNIEKARKYFEELYKYNGRDKFYAIMELGRLELNQGNIKKARKLFEQLLDTPNRLYAILELGKLEIIDGNINKAIEYFELLLDTPDKKFAIMELLMLNVNIENYEEATKYLEMLIENNFYDLARLKKYQFYLKYKLGKINYNEPIYGYFNNQLISYNKEEAIKHIKSHLDENDEKFSHTTFSPNVNINLILKLVQENIENLKKQNYGICDKYIFDFGYTVGKINGKETSFIEIVTICNTHNIITMYPVMFKNFNYNNSKKLEYKL